MLGNLSARLKSGLLERQGLIHRWAHWALPGAVLVCSLGLWSADLELVEFAKNKVFDAYQVRSPRRYDPAVPVRVVDLDDETLKRLGQWPWPRTLIATLVEGIARGAKVIAFDVVFAEPDRTSPREMAKSLPSDLKDLRGRLEKAADHDDILARTFRKVESEGTAVVASFVLLDSPTASLPKAKAPVIYRWEDALSFVEEKSGAVETLPVLSKAADGYGFINNAPDRDGVIRRARLVMRVEERLYTSLAAEALRLNDTGARRSPYKLRAAGEGDRKGKGEVAGLSGVVVGRSAIPTDENGSVMIHYAADEPARFIPAWRVLEKGFDPKLLGGGIVFVGTSAAGLKDQRPTPLNPQAPGVEVHAQLAEQVLTGHYLHRPDYAKGVERSFFLIVGVLLIVLMRRLGAIWCALLSGAAIAVFAGASLAAFNGTFGDRMLFDPVLPSLIVVAVYISSSLIGYLRTEAEKRQVRGAFSRYMSPALVEQLAKDPSRLKLGGEMREMTLMFSDIRGFTTISEQFDAHGLTQFINRYLTPMTQIVLDHQGTIDKYMGDCIMSFWNAPLDDAGHAMNACRAGLTMRRRLKELNLEWEAEAKAEGRKFIPIHAGIGINTGPCCVGNMGSDMRFDYSVLGDDVNLASRLEGQSKSYGVDIVLGPNTLQVAAGLATLELDLIKVKGKTVPVNIFTLLGDEALAGEARFKALAERHAAMLAAYRGQRWEEAEGLIKGCEGETEAMGLGLAKLYHLYADRLAACRAEPPAKDWDGVFTATTK